MINALICVLCMFTIFVEKSSSNYYHVVKPVYKNSGLKAYINQDIDDYTAIKKLSIRYSKKFSSARLYNTVCYFTKDGRVYVVNFDSGGYNPKYGFVNAIKNIFIGPELSGLIYLVKQNDFEYETSYYKISKSYLIDTHALILTNQLDIAKIKLEQIQEFCIDIHNNSLLNSYDFLKEEYEHQMARRHIFDSQHRSNRRTK